MTESLSLPLLQPCSSTASSDTNAAFRSRYKFGKTLGAGTYGTVREASCSEGKVAIKIILKKNVKGNEQMVYDELEMLQRMNHPHIVRFHDWFESRDKYYIVTQLATGGELFDRICEWGRFTEKDASQTIRQVLEAVDYLHRNNVVHRDLKPENLLYLTTADDSPLVLADFGIAKMLDSPTEVLTTMAGSFGYAAPEIMVKKGHGKPVDMWSLGVITYTLLCGYSPFRSESLVDLVDECQNGRIVFHERYWKDVSEDAKSFIKALLQPKAENRATSEVSEPSNSLFSRASNPTPPLTPVFPHSKRSITPGLPAQMRPTTISYLKFARTWPKPVSGEASRSSSSPTASNHSVSRVAKKTMTPRVTCQTMQAKPPVEHSPSPSHPPPLSPYPRASKLARARAQAQATTAPPMARRASAAQLVAPFSAKSSWRKFER